jgi:hypothetical protein
MYNPEPILDSYEYIISSFIKMIIARFMGTESFLIRYFSGNTK